MSAPAPDGGGKKGKSKKLIVLLALVLLLGGGGGAGAWFSGFLPRLLGKSGTEEAQADGHGAAKPDGGHGAKPAAAAHGAKPEPAKAEAGGGHGAKPAQAAHGAKPGDGRTDSTSPFLDLPDIVANLNGGPRRNVFVKLKAKLELSRPDDQAAVQAAMPRVLDLFQGFLREMRPEEMRGSASTYRLREELLARTNLAVPNARVVAVLFTEVLVQ